MQKSLLVAWLAAIISTIGSLYFSEVMHFTPCTLCWYQRIFMYPLVIVLGIAFYHQDLKIYRYVLPVSILGLLISAFHYAHQKIPALRAFETCSSGVPCSGQYINWGGFITIPLLALTGFFIITICMFCMLSMKKQSD